MAFSASQKVTFNEKILGFAIILCCFQIRISHSQGELRVGFYSQTCPVAESIVKSIVEQANQSNPRMPSMLLRLYFHDCFVQGCDGSILIDNVQDPEKKAFGHEGVDGFEQIAKAKAQLESECPGVVSCADIVALAARDSVVLSGGPYYDVETGRRDGRVSSLSHAADLPDVDEPIDSLKAKFLSRGLTEKELVLLSAAHTIGTTACFFMPKRLYNFTGHHDTDPSINSQLLAGLKGRCPINGDVNVRVPMDIFTDQVFDDQILRNIKNGLAVIASDARLYDDIATRQVIDSYVSPQIPSNVSSFGHDFGVAMAKLGRVGVITGSDGEIRRVCSSFN